MAFQDIHKVESDAFYIDVAFRKATEKADKLRGKFISEDRISKSKQIESWKVKTVQQELSDRLLAILRNFPDLDDLHEFYRELIRATLDWRMLKQSLGAVNWALKQVTQYGMTTNRKINSSSTPSVMNKQRREYYGRCASFLKQIRKNLAYLEQTRTVMRSFPNVKTGIPTIAIVGFPNVGKTTLLQRLTGSRAEINSYAFTTKGINVGYISKGKKEKVNKGEKLKERRKIQLLDTPGTLNRPDKMNTIEKIAHFALTLLADRVIYVFDVTEPFPLEDQIALYKNVQKLNLPMVTYVSKTDILQIEQYIDLVKTVQAKVNIDELKAFLA